MKSEFEIQFNIFKEHFNHYAYNHTLILEFLSNNIGESNLSYTKESFV